MTKPMPNSFFRALTQEDIGKFKAAARARYTPGDEVSEYWHPVYRAECELMNAEAVQAAGDVHASAPPIMWSDSEDLRR